jgi:hypothetical protein
MVMGLLLLIVLAIIVSAAIGCIGNDPWPHDILDGNDHQWKE